MHIQYNFIPIEFCIKTYRIFIHIILISAKTILHNGGEYYSLYIINQTWGQDNFKKHTCRIHITNREYIKFLNRNEII